ncbi:kelch-like protein 23 [Clavelina lepadiformis]|uniref:kelch-like protein 23 n=1 Tax=Clavelina lepadiformis TaxID=159417 RepID=UPI00404248A2
MSSPSISSPSKHIMISYNQRDSKELANKIHDRLSDAGYQVWIDKGQMKGNIYDKMGQAVENAHVVLMFLSPNYETSENCIRESSLTADMAKRIVPIRVLPDGYQLITRLRLLTAGLLYYNFNKRSFDENFNQLLDEIESIPGIEMTRKVETKLHKMKIAETPGQSDEILVIGGLRCEHSVVKLKTRTKQWSDMPDTNVAREFPSAVNYNQQILLMGGSEGRTYYNSVEMLDLNDENPKWDNNVPSMGEKRSAFASALLDGLVYCAGGYNGTNRLSSCESYNPEERKWSSIRNMNKKRTYHALVSARGLLYALGGYDCDDYDFRTNTAECYDPRNGKWEYIPPMKTCRDELTAVVLKNEIYAIGRDGGSNHLSSVEKYNLDTKTWIDVASTNEERNGGSACVVDGLIWVFGGEDAETVEFYDPATNKWQVSTNMDRQRECPCVLSI